jgi:hypothetical protein
MDCYWYLFDDSASAPRGMTGAYNQWTESALYFDLAFDEGNMDGTVVRPSVPAGHSLRENWERKRLLDKDSALPDSIADLLMQTIEEVFYDGDKTHPLILRANEGRPTPELIKEAYDLLFRYLKFSTVDGFAHEIPPPPDVFPNLDPPTITDPGDGLDDSDDDFWDDVLDFILAVVSVILFILEAIAWLATFIWAVLADLVTYPLRLGLYYALELPLFQLLKSFRMVLVMTGYFHPMEDEIAQSVIRIGNPTQSTWQQVVDELGDTFGGTLPEKPRDDRSGEPFVDEDYPHQHAMDEFHHPWDYPTSPLEKKHTTAGPSARNAGPRSLFREVAPDTDILERLEIADSPDAADLVGADVTPARNMGDSVSFSKYLVWLGTRIPPERGTGSSTHGPKSVAPIVDWNLDADRGYGYHCWDWNRQPKENGMAHDPNGNEFLKPCTWPAQSKDDQAVPEAPDPIDLEVELALHWADHEDPGCAPPPPIG